jgi:hypothetical protein
MAITAIPGKKPEYKPGGKLSTSEKLQLSSNLMGIVEGFGNTLADANSLRNKADTYALNAKLDNVDAQEALRVGQQNAQIVNMERYQTKGKQLSYFAGTGFAATSGSAADTLAHTDAEYYKTMAAIHYEAESAKNAKEFESKINTIQSSYMKKVASIRSKYGTISAIAGAVGTVALAKAGAAEGEAD